MRFTDIYVANWEKKNLLMASLKHLSSSVSNHGSGLRHFPAFNISL